MQCSSCSHGTETDPSHSTEAPLLGEYSPDDSNTLPMNGFRVLELGDYIAGPTAARMLVDFGAQVIKVERVVDRGMGSPVMREVDDPREYVELCGTVEICNRWINGAVHYMRCSGDV